jgi:hypothetical protein
MPLAKITTRPLLDAWMPKGCRPGWLFLASCAVSVSNACRREPLVDRDIDAADPRDVQSHMADEVPAAIDDSVHHRSECASLWANAADNAKPYTMFISGGRNAPA